MFRVFYLPSLHSVSLCRPPRIQKTNGKFWGKITYVSETSRTPCIIRYTQIFGAIFFGTFCISYNRDPQAESYLEIQMLMSFWQSIGRKQNIPSFWRGSSLRACKNEQKVATTARAAAATEKMLVHSRPSRDEVSNGCEKGI